ncbi:hypothetical protein KDH_15880 [Dictyobacter sp. S3.2.2.5]|uniref:Proteinase inhibitor I42 chagasin domain-containing protein n=1 Tax=Dictyobacter halimunensis TaxID=3026934 RepID=A0ABQ6FKE9_9CHLR|nr:hypothetical protein KDH_15880 [Dictyobacter sp. S3.2.2.5]
MMKNTSGALWNVQRLTGRQKLCLSLFLGFLFIFACAFRSAGAPVTLTQANNGSLVTVAPNTLIVVRLPSNASTGYSWSVAPPLSPLLRFQGQHYIAPTPTVPPRVGAPGTEEFTFLAQSLGTAQLRLVYKHPWETMQPPAQTFSVTIHIQTFPYCITPGSKPKLVWPLSCS